MAADRTLAFLAVTLALVFGAAGCLEPREAPVERHTSNCTTCHGSPTRAGSELTRAAPPFDVSGQTALSARGVGAHLVHLTGDETHVAVPCDTCHQIPEATDSPGHADTALPAEVTLIGLAAANERAPRYDAASQSCSDTYCHLKKTPTWIPDAAPAERCARCHAMPPPAPHPASTDCYLCHGEVIDAEKRFVDPSRHVDGVLDVAERCDLCHGSGELGAPPPDLAGAIEPTSPGVGAHVAHLAGGEASRPVACTTCHVVPERAGDAGHLDDTLGAEVLFTSIATSHDREPSWDRENLTCAGSWCHGPVAGAVPPAPIWNQPGPLACDGCHAMPPAAPHPQMDACVLCHGTVIDETGAIFARERHVDGQVDVAIPEACNSCHGDAELAAPPFDLAGHEETTWPGVGAHRAHLEGSGIARTLACSECHSVPEAVLDEGHIDTRGGAEVSITGVGRSFGAQPVYDGARCSESFCHGARFVLGHASGGQATEPLWTLVDGSQKACTSCHGLPPPAPHPPGPLFCNACHPTVGLTLEILDPEHHVDGFVDLVDPP
jgi:predicted CxxxxCH...CXXCH cytochrome family protein